MREIKFRAWDDQQTCMIYPNQGIVNNMQSWEILQRFDIVMQHTGLKDKNGTEIYEGDIVQAYYTHKLKGGIFEIRYLERSFSMTQNKEDTELDCVWFHICEVIGNIYENPELLNTP